MQSDCTTPPTKSVDLVCATAGCDKSTLARGLCAKHYMQWRTAHKPVRSCPACGQMFHPAEKDRVYCSRKCGASPRVVPRLTVACTQCGASLIRLESRKGRPFCSQACQHRWLSENRRGPRHHNWAGGTHRKEGYIVVSLEAVDPKHRMIADGMASARGYVPEHRLVVAIHIGRALRRDEQVHHINEVRSDNRLENLELLSTTDHGRRHMGNVRRITRENELLRQKVAELEAAAYPDASEASVLGAALTASATA